MLLIGNNLDRYVMRRNFLANLDFQIRICIFANELTQNFNMNSGGEGTIIPSSLLALILADM